MKTINLRANNFGIALLLLVGITCLSSGNVVAETTGKDPTASNTGARARMGEANEDNSEDSSETRGDKMEGKSNTNGDKSEANEDKIDASLTLRKSTELYEAIVKGKHGQVPDDVIAKAQCITVVPEVITGAIVVGGSHGVGITSCREGGKWSSPAFVTLNAVSVGAQLGGKSSDMVIFIVNESAKAALKRGSFTVGAEASAVAGTFDKNFEISSHGAVVYTRMEGAFAGAALSGGKITSDAENTQAFYGKDVNYVSLLEGGVNTKPNAQVDRFTSLLPK